MHKLLFDMELPAKFEEDLKRLLFFNKRQIDYKEGIDKAINQYGMPEILNEEGILKIRISGLPDVQTIFARDGKGKNSTLLGAVIFYRHSVEEIDIIHIFIQEDLASGGKISDEIIAFRLMAQVKEVAKKLKGTERIQLPYVDKLSSLSFFPVK